MSDADLEDIRKARLAQLQAGGGPRSSGPSGAGADGEAEQRRQQEEDVRSSILSQILTPEAADRLGRIRLVKESRAREIEDRLIGMARSGRLSAKISEAQLKDLLGAVAEREQEVTQAKVVVSRRKGGWDDEDEEELDF